MTVIAELGAGMVKAAVTAVPAAMPAVATAVPKVAAETMATGVKALAEPVATLPKTVEAVAKPVFEAATTPMAELGNGVIRPSIAGEVLDAVPTASRLDMLARGFFSGTELGGDTLAHTLTVPEMSALAQAADIRIPQEILSNPEFAKAFSGALRNRLTKGPEQGKEFSLSETIRASLHDAVESRKQDEKELEKLKKKATIKAIKRRMNRWRNDIVHDKRMNPDEKQEALEMVTNHESQLILEANIRMTFGRNVLTNAIGAVLTMPAA